MLEGANEIKDKLKINEQLDLRDETTDHAGPQTLLRTQVKTAAYTCLVTDSGTHFFTYGATAHVTFTLPTTIVKGWHAYFYNSVDYNLTITAGTVDTLITFNDAAADSIAFSTSSDKIGACAKVICDGNAYHAIAYSAGGDFTVTVGT